MIQREKKLELMEAGFVLGTNLTRQTQVVFIADGMINSGNDGWLGYDIKTENTVDMKEAGIIDPTKVVRLALENAASVAGTVLLTECTVVSEPEKENNSQPQMDPSMMGMM